MIERCFMIIDAHTHIYPEAVAPKAIKTIIGNTGGQLTAYTDGTFQNLMSSMDEAEIDFSVVLSVATQPNQGEKIIQWIDEMRNRSSRLIYFASVHPADPDFKKRIQDIKDRGIPGIKFHPAYQNFPVDSKEAYDVYEEALKNDLVLHFHSGFDMSLPHCDYTSVERFSRFLESFKNSKIILAHAGGDQQWEEVLKKLGDKGCFFDIAFVLENMKRCDHARELYRQNENYFVFGTDTPWKSQKDYVKMIRESKTLTSEQRDKMFFKNILKLISLPS